jgi:hypothetical protein
MLSKWIVILNFSVEYVTNNLSVSKDQIIIEVFGPSFVSDFCSTSSS